MSENRIVYAVLTDNDQLAGKYAIVQRVIVGPKKTLSDALNAIEKRYPTAQFITWVTTHITHSNGSSDIRVK